MREYMLGLKFLSHDILLGRTDIANEGVWTWTDGTRGQIFTFSQSSWLDYPCPTILPSLAARRAALA